MLAVGGLGNLASTGPLAMGAEQLGWRAVFLCAAAVSAATAALTLAVVRDAPPGAPPSGAQGESLRQALRGVAAVMRNRQLHLLLPLNSCAYGALMAVLALWGRALARSQPTASMRSPRGTR